LTVAILTEAPDRVVREVGNEPGGCDEAITSRVDGSYGEGALRATARADEMNMVVFAGVVILRSPFDVGVGQDPHFLE
jgi:hypothetical protein